MTFRPTGTWEVVHRYLRPGNSDTGPPTNPLPFGVTASNDDRPPVAIAAQWVSQITGIGVEIILPILAGRWLDQRWGTSCWTVVGAVLGPLLGFWHLFRITGVVGGTKTNSGEKNDEEDGRL